MKSRAFNQGKIRLLSETAKIDDRRVEKSKNSNSIKGLKSTVKFVDDSRFTVEITINNQYKYVSTKTFWNEISAKSESSKVISAAIDILDDFEAEDFSNRDAFNAMEGYLASNNFAYVIGVDSMGTSPLG